MGQTRQGRIDGILLSNAHYFAGHRKNFMERDSSTKCRQVIFVFTTESKVHKILRDKLAHSRGSHNTDKAHIAVNRNNR